MDISSFPIDIWNIIIEQLVIIIGIKNAVLLRKTSKAFDTAIMQAICVSQVVDICDPCTPTMPYRMETSLMGRIYLVKSRSNPDVTQDLLFVIDNVNRRLDMLTGQKNDLIREKQHLAVAKMISFTPNFRKHGPDLDPYSPGYASVQGYDPTWDAHNLFSGAIVIGDLRLVKTLLEEQQTSNPPIDVNGATPYFRKPLVVAAFLGHLEIVRYLLKKGARSDQRCRCKKKCFTARRSHGKYGRFFPRYSGLKAAVFGRNKDVLRELLLPEYRLTRCIKENMAALIRAARVDVQTINMILDVMEGKKLSEFPQLLHEMLEAAIMYGPQEVVQMLLDCSSHGFKGYDGFEGMCAAARLGKTDIMRFLVDRGVGIGCLENCKEHLGPCSSPLPYAAAGCHEAAVEMLLDLGADPAIALRSAVEECQPRITKLVLDRYPDLLDREEGRHGRLALSYAVKSKNLRNIKLLVDRGVSLNHGYKNAGEELPINTAKNGKGRWMVDYLLSLGAQDTDAATIDEDLDLTSTTDGVHITERTWQWVGKY
ncbi:hypothetical protein E4U42_004964 [Claviceps africana]|uniref:Ankyrin n=1 Tax=Claviceps africana TaxID=83212 RepID=A0A8K0J4X2_9HYPO|nr:hypothetical protein E4U42_004964 [Claviceps africana]